MQITALLTHRGKTFTSHMLNVLFQLCEANNHIPDIPLCGCLFQRCTASPHPGLYCCKAECASYQCACSTLEDHRHSSLAVLILPRPSGQRRSRDCCYLNMRSYDKKSPRGARQAQPIANVVSLAEFWSRYAWRLTRRYLCRSQLRLLAEATSLHSTGDPPTRLLHTMKQCPVSLPCCSCSKQANQTYAETSCGILAEAAPASYIGIG